MTITAENLVSREVHYCVSTLVSELAKGFGGTNEELGDIAEAAFELACPIDDWEEAAIQEGWKAMGGIAVHKEVGAYDLSAACAWQDLCEEYNIEPYQREVFEHWIVSDWLADKLAEKGEKVDKDFAGLTVWARTTTDQGIASDSVIEAIVADINK
jgi:hypothetical protein